MKKTFIKGLVAVATVALTMSFSALLVSAEELDMTTAPGETSGIFTVGASVTTKGEKSYTLTGETTARKNAGYSLGSNIGNGIGNSVYFTTNGPAKLTVVALGGGSGVRGLDLYKDVDGTPTKVTEVVSTPDNATMTEGTYDITEAGTYYLARMAGKTMVIYYVDVTPTTGTVYDQSLFGDETTDNTATLPGDTASNSITCEDVISATVNGATFNDKDALGAEYTSGNITFGSGLLMYNDGTLRTGGSTQSSNNKYVAVDANAGDVIVLDNCRSQNTGDATRVVYLSSEVAGTRIVEEYAPVEKASVSLPVETAGKYYVCFSNGVQFEGVSVYEGVEVIAPSVTLAQTTVTDSSKVAFKGTISGNASDKTPVTAINVVTAKGYDASGAAVDAKTHSINVVAEDGSDYAFIVTIDKATVDALPGLKIQASVDYDVNGSTEKSYSAVVDYIA